MCLFIHMLMLLDIAITGGVNLRSNFSPSVEIYYKVWKNVPSVVSCLWVLSVAVVVFSDAMSVESISFMESL